MLPIFKRILGIEKLERQLYEVRSDSWALANTQRIIIELALKQGVLNSEERSLLEEEHMRMSTIARKAPHEWPMG